MYMQNRNRLMDIENQLVIKGEREGEKDKLTVSDWEKQTTIYKIDKQ